ncbi:envelope stress sensor histidine kinase CpxA [Marinomonas pollencensis]|uniref:histidine kinase n=1 Tax=Marinomonas pollencensis TaxID=491954 RepID=A0A3E0DF17_9GAMM|nr:envelope stress sensor histidine kinase CpxA [Marinomonas pollencensis]REG81299.1 two-component system sensor histidine kinase CpxA [Marinomonas pollencensis]
MRLPKITSLYGRIFAIFWFTMFLVLMAVLALPHLDPRNVKELPQDRYNELLTLTKHIEHRFAAEKDISIISQSLVVKYNDYTQQLDQEKQQTLRARKEHSQPPMLFIVDDKDTILTQYRAPNFVYRTVRNFITSVDAASFPKQRLYGRFMVSGPIPIKLADAQYQLYLGERWNRPPGFLFQLFDHPFQLLLAVMLVSTPLLLWLSWALSQPARRLEKAAQSVARGEFTIDPELEKGTSEFRQAGASFNQMVQAVNQMISRQQRLLSDISHELRSPLTRLRMAQALATRKQGESQELIRIDTEAQRLEQMISKLLELSRMQVDSHVNREKQPLQSLWEALLEDTQFEAEQMGKKLTFNPIPARDIYGHPQLLVSALENIIRNAIYYGKDTIKVTMTASTEQLIVRVEDNGEGVPEEELSDIFRPFYRVSTARDRHTGGTGLGLSITESAIRQHNGAIQASRSALGGLLVEIHLPLA